MKIPNNCIGIYDGCDGTNEYIDNGLVSHNGNDCPYLFLNFYPSGVENKYVFEAFINDMDTNNRLAFSNLHIDTDFTVQYLKSLGFEWSKIDLEYLKKYMEYFKELGYWGCKP